MSRSHDVPRSGLGFYGAGALLLALLTGCGGPHGRGAVAASPADPAAPAIRLPDGFTATTWAADVPGARSLCVGDQGTVFVGTRGAGVVYALADRDGDGRAERRWVVASGLNSPNGVAFRDGSLYIAEISRIVRLDGIEGRLDHPPDPVLVSDAFPSATHHGWKFIAFGPDGMLYVPVGAPCNVCEPPGKLFATITRMRPDGSGLEVFAKGVRNSVGFDWRPGSDVLWFTDNGRDWMGDDRPPDELNRAPRAGMDFGFPYCFGADIQDPDLGSGHPCSDFVPPAFELGPHVAPLGMRFYRGSRFPPAYRGQIFIAEHGSWNRSVKIGYRVVVVHLEGDRAVSREVFARGWLRGDGSVWGRPVDVQELGDGSLLVSDDQAGAVYRIDFTG